MRPFGSDTVKPVITLMVIAVTAVVIFVMPVIPITVVIPVISDDMLGIPVVGITYVLKVSATYRQDRKSQKGEPGYQSFDFACHTCTCHLLSDDNGLRVYLVMMK